MSNINNKNESRCAHSTSPPPSPLSPLASCHSEHSHEWCLNGNVWVAARAELSVARMSAYLCCAYWRHLRPPRPRTVSHLHSSLFLRSPPSTPLESSANRKYLCIMQSELRRIHNIEGVAREGVRLRIAMPNNGNLLAENLIFMPPPSLPSLPLYLTVPLRV